MTAKILLSENDLRLFLLSEKVFKIRIMNILILYKISSI